MNVTKIKAYYGFAVKSNNIIFGTDGIIDKKPLAVFVSDVLSENSQKKVKNICDLYELKLIKINKIDMDKITQNQKIMAFGISDRNLAEAVINCME